MVILSLPLDFIIKAYLISELIVTKSVKQPHHCRQLDRLMEEFRHMVNEAIRIGIEKNITSKLRLRNELYLKFKNEFHTCYISMAVFKAHALLKSYRKSFKKNSNTKKPYVQKKFFVVNSFVYRILDGDMRIPTRPREFVKISLNKYTLNILSEPNLKFGNATISSDTISISFSKDIDQKKPHGYMGIDTNLANATSIDERGKTTVVDMSSIISRKIKYRDIISHFTRHDVRIQKRLKSKYGQKQKNYEDTYLHQKSKEIISMEKQIFVENLKGMRNLYKRGNGQGVRFRFKMNSWTRFKWQKMLDYKSQWQNGFPVIFVNPSGTSSKCSICEAKMILEENRMLYCSRCGLHIDRDVNAARNILARGMQFVPDAVQGEVMKQSKEAEQIAPNLFVGMFR